MSIIKTNIDSKSIVTQITDLLLMQSEKSILFLDTNVLIWLYRVNEMARLEFFGWLKELKEDNLLRIPAWSIHEYNVHLEQKKDEVFFPLRKLSKQISSNLQELENYSLLIASNELVKDSGFKSRKELIKKTKNSIQDISEVLKCLGKIKDKNYLNVRNEIETLFEDSILQSDIYKLQELASVEATTRFKNRIPPGYLDNGKDENNIGDLIIWKEILNCCEEENVKNAFFLTLDNKTDWVSYPEKITLEGIEKSINYDKKTHSRYFMPKPSLVNEFRHKMGQDSTFNIINIELLTETLEKMSWEQYDHNRFENLASAINIYWQDTPTSIMIKWFIENDEICKEALKGVCKWERSPDEIDFDEFRKWALTKDIPKKNIENVNWTDVFCSFGL